MENTITEEHELPIMIWKIGDREKNWLPSKKHFDAMREILTVQHITERFHCIVTHAFCDVQIVPSKDGQPTTVNITTVPYEELEKLFKDKLGKSVEELEDVAENHTN